MAPWLWEFYVHMSAVLVYVVATIALVDIGIGYGAKLLMTLIVDHCERLVDNSLFYWQSVQIIWNWRGMVIFADQCL